MRTLLRFVGASGVALLSACGPKPAGPAAPRESGQSQLMGQTFAGKNACNPKNHARPFVIEWDATDRSSFEAVAANDIVFVRYEGCELVVLDECRNGSVRGEKGAYLPPEWTSGALETIDIKTAGELAAKLPLGVATLGGRIAGGEAFHMEYYVAGTRQATRDAVYRADVAGDVGCEGATHFVHAYNLGAFALGSSQDQERSAHSSVYGFGAGGGTSDTRQAEKRGGDLSICRAGDTERKGCQAPIRLSLREVRSGENPEAQAKATPDTDASLNAAGRLAQQLDMSQEARARADAAERNLAARDGNACLSELDAHAKLDPKHASTSADSPLAYTRSLCLMLAGKCTVGRQLLRDYLDRNPVVLADVTWSADVSVSRHTNRFCQGELPPRDDFIRSVFALSQVERGIQAGTSERCAKHVKVVNKHWDAVRALKDPELDDILRKTTMRAAMRCFEEAGDCDGAWNVYGDFIRRLEQLEDGFWSSPRWKSKTAAEQLELRRGDFAEICPTCKGTPK